MQGYADDPQVSFAAIGDAPCNDEFPIQIADFSAGAKMDSWISKLFHGGNGGGTGEESYELTALYYARYCQLAPGTRGVFFVSGDEHFYSTLRQQDVEKFLGPEAAAAVGGDLTAAQIFHELQAKP